jgi:hypothetical protein
MRKAWSLVCAAVSLSSGYQVVEAIAYPKPQFKLAVLKKGNFFVTLLLWIPDGFNPNDPGPG